MSLTEPTAWPAVTGDEPLRAWSQLRSLSVGPAEGAADWADDDRLDELFSAWARAAVATDAAPDGFAAAPDAFAAADDSWPPVPAEPTELDPPVHFAMARQHLARHREVGRGPTLEPDEPVTAWTRADDDIIPTRRGGGRRWGRRRG